MPIKYFGKQNKNFGKPLWEIVMNLKNFGKGRIVQSTRCTSLYTEEPTFYRIVRVEPHSLNDHPGRMIGNLWVETTFRGRKLDEPEDLGSVAFKDDFQLIPKHEEDAFCNRGKAHLTPTNILPRTAPFPPLWIELMQRQRRKKGITDYSDSELSLIYNFSGNPLKRVAEEGEEPTIRITPAHTTALHEEYYKGVIFDRKEASEYYGKIHESRKLVKNTQTQQ